MNQGMSSLGAKEHLALLRATPSHRNVLLEKLRREEAVSILANGGSGTREKAVLLAGHLRC